MFGGQFYENYWCHSEDPGCFGCHRRYDKIVAWAKKLLGCCQCECQCDCEGDCDDCQCEDDCDDCDCVCSCNCCCAQDVAEEVAEEAAEEVVEEAPAEDVVQAEEADFEG